MQPEIDQRLARWGRYMRMRSDYGLGYPSRSPIHRMMVEGPGAGSQGRVEHQPMPADVAEIESILTALEPRERKLASVIYIEGKGVPVLRRMMGVSDAFMEEVLERLHIRVAARLQPHLKDVG